MTKVKPTDEDFRQAFMRRTINGAKEWEGLKADARQIAAERMIEANQREQKELCDALAAAAARAQSGTAAGSVAWDWRKTQARLDALFKAHDELMDIAYPSATP